MSVKWSVLKYDYIIYLIRLRNLILIFAFYNNLLYFIGTLQPSDDLVKQSADKQTILTGTDYLSIAPEITFGS